MREIKFRVWDKFLKKFVTTPVAVNVDGSNLVTWDWHIDKGKIWGEISKDGLTIQQYSGLNDENGVEIYEGDIQKSTNGKHYAIYVVDSVGGQFGNCLFSLPIEDNYSTDDDDEYTYEPRISTYQRNYVKSGESVEVIGNIFQTPELLTLT